MWHRCDCRVLHGLLIERGHNDRNDRNDNLISGLVGKHETGIPLITLGDLNPSPKPKPKK